MSEELNKEIRNAVYEAIETSLSYQLNAIRKLRQDLNLGKLKPKNKPSQPDMVYAVIKEAGKPLHISEIISEIEKKFNKKLDRESLVSAITKKVNRHDRFIRTGKNTFGLLED